MNDHSHRFNAYDEALINADIASVYRAMMAEFTGRTSWWQPLWEASPVGELPVSVPGGEINITVHDVIDIHFSARTVAVQQQEWVEVEFYRGDFTGFATWRWQVEENHTRVSMEWHATPSSFKLKLGALFFNVENIHSRIIQRGFKALNTYLARS